MFPLWMMMKWYYNFIWWTLLLPYTQCKVLSSTPYFTSPPIWSYWIRDSANAWTSSGASPKCKIQKEIVITESTTYKIECAVDNIMDVYLDWIFLFTHNWFTTTKKFYVNLNVWTHRILADCTNVWSQAWFCMSIRKQSDNSLLYWSDATWSYTTNTWF